VDPLFSLMHGLGSIPLLSDSQTRSISAENPTGAIAGGAHEDPKGEGEIKFFLDSDPEYPTICGTGTEDYFGGAWGFGDTFSTPFLGYPLWRKEPGEVPKHGLYRWHIMDPIRFRERLHVTIQALGWWPNGRFQPLEDDIASVGYWYQAEPHAPFPAIPGREGRWPR
jgi:hypothetical protein